MALIAAFGVTLSCSRTEPGFDLGPWTDAGAGAAGEGASGGAFQSGGRATSGGAGGKPSSGGGSGAAGTAPGGATSTGGSSTGGAAPGGAPSTGGTSTGGSSTTGGTAGSGAVGSGGVDCSVIGCSPPPFCDSGCTAPCGCCACAEGSNLDPTTVCLGGCWARVTDAGAQDAGRSTACTTSAKCLAPDYCSQTGTCLASGTCREPIDCDDPDNPYPHKGCPGYGECAGGRCLWQCGDARCRDVTGVSFGECGQFLGFGVMAGQCVAISGCDPGGYTLAASLSECQATCLRGNPNRR